MKNFIFFAVTLFLSLNTAAQNSEIRNSYHAATKSEENAGVFYNLVKDVTKSDKAEMIAYKGAAKALLARYEPLAKRKSKLKEGIEWVEDAVSKSPQNPEVRLVRLSIQESLPKFLNYHKNIEEDRSLIKKALPTIKDKGLVEMINGYFNEFSKK